ncbi:D-arabinono-1,4-lactone oxidase [Nocardioides sp. NPDC126508]
MTTWTNWAGDETCTPHQYLSPRTVEELATAVEQAAAAGRTVRVVGAGHSFSDLVCTDGLLLDLDHLNGIQHVDRDAGLVTVGAGTRLFDLNPALAELGLALPNLGDIDRQSVAGAVSTATHGTGRLLGNLATQVASVDLVLADGSIRKVTEDDPETLRAARVSLGALGVATSYQLRVVPAFALHARAGSMPVAEVVDRLDELVETNDHFEFFLFPHAEAALVKTNNRTDRPLAPPHPLVQRASEFVENGVFEAACRLGRRFPSRIPAINRAITRLDTSTDHVDQSHRVFASRRSVRFTEMEIAVPRESCTSVLEEIQHTIARQRLDVGFPIEVRFVAADEDSHLSPSYGRPTAYLAVHMYRGMAWRAYFEAVQKIALAHEGRPHWGKRHLFEADQLARLYPAWDRFQAVRTELDPHGTFTNDHVRRVLGPVRDSSVRTSEVGRASR